VHLQAHTDVQTHTQTQMCTQVEAYVHIQMYNTSQAQRHTVHTHTDAKLNALKKYLEIYI